MDEDIKIVEELKQAKSNVLRGNDIESAALILEKNILDNWIIKGGRVDILKVATRQILTFVEDAKNKDILDYVRENVSLKTENKQLKEENKASRKVIAEQCDYIQNKSVSKDKIIKLINKIDNKANRAAGTYQYSASNEDLENKKTQVRYYDHFIKELQELLEGDN